MGGHVVRFWGNFRGTTDAKRAGTLTHSLCFPDSITVFRVTPLGLEPRTNGLKVSPCAIHRDPQASRNPGIMGKMGNGRPPPSTAVYRLWGSFGVFSGVAQACDLARRRAALSRFRLRVASWLHAALQKCPRSSRALRPVGINSSSHCEHWT